MTIDTQSDYLDIIKDSFKDMKGLLTHIEENIIEYPVYTQLAFIKQLKSVIFYAFEDSCNKDDKFLNDYDGGDKIEI